MPQLVKPVGPTDHTSGGDENSPVTLVEYGDFECSYCGRAYANVKSAQKALGPNLRFVFRNFPLATLHENAENAAESAEIAADSDKFWEMHDTLFEHQNALDADSLIGYAESVGLDARRFSDDLERHVKADRVREDFLSGAKSGVNGTPTFFINGERYDGRWEHGSLLRALREVGGVL